MTRTISIIQAIEKLLETATAHHRAGKFAEARHAYRQVLAQAPAHTLALYRSGLLELQDGHPDTALALVEQAIAADANYAPAHRNLAVLLDLYMGDPATALGEFVKYQMLTNEQKPVSGWIAELRNRTGIRAPVDAGAAAQAPAATDPAAAPAPPPAAAPVPPPSGGTS